MNWGENTLYATYLSAKDFPSVLPLMQDLLANIKHVNCKYFWNMLISNCQCHRNLSASLSDGTCVWRRSSIWIQNMDGLIFLFLEHLQGNS